MYPSIFIAAAIEAEGHKLSKQLRRRGVFSEVTTFERILKLKESPALLIVISKTYSSKAYAALLYAKVRLSGTKTMLIGDSSEYTNADIDSCRSYTLANKDNCISDDISRLTGYLFTFAERNSVASDMSDTPFTYFRGTRMFLTDPESQVVHILASFDEHCVSMPDIARFINVRAKSISSYVSSINQKSRNLTGEAMIFSVRSKGYSLFDEAK